MLGSAFRSSVHENLVVFSRDKWGTLCTSCIKQEQWRCSAVSPHTDRDINGPFCSLGSLATAGGTIRLPWKDSLAEVFDAAHRVKRSKLPLQKSHSMIGLVWCRECNTLAEPSCLEWVSRVDALAIMLEYGNHLKQPTWDLSSSSPRIALFYSSLSTLIYIHTYSSLHNYVNYLGSINWKDYTW